MAEASISPEGTGGNPCPVCAFVNTPERVYCQDCGAKLGIAPPSYVAKTAPAPPLAGPSPVSKPVTRPAVKAPTAKKPRILSTNHRPKLGGRILSAIGPILYLATLALGAAALWPPANIPPAATTLDDETLAAVRTRFSEAANSGQPVDAPWTGLNAYLAAVLHPDQAGGSVSSSFVRAFVQPQPGGFTLTIEKTLLRIPIYTAVHYRIAVRDHHLTLEATGSQIGRLPLPTAAAPVTKILSGNLAEALAEDLAILRRAQVVRLSPEAAHFEFAAPKP